MGNDRFSIHPRPDGARAYKNQPDFANDGDEIWWHGNPSTLLRGTVVHHDSASDMYWTMLWVPAGAEMPCKVITGPVPTYTGQKDVKTISFTHHVDQGSVIWWRPAITGPRDNSIAATLDWLDDRCIHCDEPYNKHSGASHACVRAGYYGNHYVPQAGGR